MKVNIDKLLNGGVHKLQTAWSPIVKKNDYSFFPEQYTTTTPSSNINRTPIYQKKDIGVVNKIKSAINPKNWGVTDYSNSKDFSNAYKSARESGEKEFMYNGKRYSSNMSGTPQQQLKWSGITNDRLGISGNLEKRAYNTIIPSYYDGENGEKSTNVKNFIKNRNRFYAEKEYNSLMETMVKEDSLGHDDNVASIIEKANVIRNDYMGSDDKPSEDGWSIYLGQPQKHNSFGISNYKPNVAKDTNVNYYTVNDKFSDELFDLYKNKQIKKGLINESSFQRGTISENGSRARVLGNFTLDEGKDKKGNYISYYDKYDIEPTIPVIGKIKIDNIVGKPFEIYDRIYYKKDNKGNLSRIK